MKLSREDVKKLEEGGLIVPLPKGRPRKKFMEGSKPDGKQGRDILFDRLCEAHGLPVPVMEYAFAKDIGRKWQFDFLFEGCVALEVEGLAAGGSEGRHQKIGGWIADMEKYNEAAIMGYVLIRCTTGDIKSGKVFATIRRALGMEELS